MRGSLPEGTVDAECAPHPIPPHKGEGAGSSPSPLWAPLWGGMGRGWGARHRVARLGVAVACLATLTLGPARALDDLDLRIGRALFNRAWVPAPASTQADDGLGPLFDARSCAACHRGAGRAAVAVDANGALEGRGVVLALARPDGSGDPVYGRRLQVDAAPGIQPEAVLGVRDFSLPDGRRGRAPVAVELGYGPLDPATGTSLRAAPDLRGRGAIGRVADADLLAIEAEQADGVRGRARRVALADGRTVLGRFGWKASQPTLAAATAWVHARDHRDRQARQLGDMDAVFPGSRSVHRRASRSLGGLHRGGDGVPARAAWGQ